MDLCFTSYGSRKLYAKMYYLTIASYKLFKKCGFEIEGVLSNHVLIGDRLDDVLIMSRYSVSQ